MKKLKNGKDFITKMLSVFLCAAMGVIATPFLNQEFVTALADSGTSNTNVAYFEGMVPDMSDSAIHSATRMSAKSSENPAMTFFVHGQSGDASHWSNNNKYEFAYDEKSLIEKLRDDYGGANVYWARMSRDNDNGFSNGIDDAFEGKVDYPYEENRFFLTKLNDGKYIVDKADYEKQEFVTQLDDVSKHIIVVYESADPKAYHREEYKGLHTIVDRLSYDYRQLTGKLPKVDFISHSRGGITSMLYATGYRQDSKLAKVEYSKEAKDGYTAIGDGVYEKEQTYSTNGSLLYDHPYNVNCLYSIGSPYNGTKMDNALSREVLPESFNSESAKNILDETLQSEIKKGWNEACTKNNKLKLYACAGEMTVGFLIGLIGEDRLRIQELLEAAKKEEEIKEILSTVDTKLDEAINELNKLENWLKEIEEACKSGSSTSITVGLLFPGLAGLAFASFVTSEGLEAICSLLLQEIPAIYTLKAEYDQKTQVSDKLLVVDKFMLRYYGFLELFKNFILKNTSNTTGIASVEDVGDGFISTGSQLAEGYSNVVQYRKEFYYEGLEITEGADCAELTYTYRNFDSSKRTIDSVAIPHNLETYDEELQGHIRDSIRMEKLEQLQGMTISLVSGSTTGNWKVKVVNGNKTAGTVVYNERMCFEDDAKNFHHLTNLRSFRLSPGGEKTVTITGFGTADYIALAFSYTLPSGKIIYSVIYANNLNASSLTMGSPQRTIVPNGKDLGGDLVPNYLSMSINKKVGTTWYINLSNTNEEAVSVTYNSKMCFDDAARNFYGLRDLVDVTIPGKSTKSVTISENLTANYITAAINYTIDGVKYRRITSANELSTSGTLKQRRTEIQVVAGFPEVDSVPNYVTMVPVSRSGFIYYTWGIKITNPNSFAVEVSYNAKLCFEGDAKAFEGLADIVTVTIAANSSKTVTINHNGTAGWIAASVNYSYNGYEYRRITYADGLATNPYRTNTAKHNQIRFT